MVTSERETAHQTLGKRTFWFAHSAFQEVKHINHILFIHILYIHILFIYNITFSSLFFFPNVLWYQFFVAGFRQLFVFGIKQVFCRAHRAG